MAIPVILQGDSSGEVTISLAEGHNYAGATLVVVFNGVSRQYTNLTAGGSVMLAFTADETAGMPLGTALVNMRLVGANGGVETVGNADARIKVTDCVAEVNAGGSFAVTPGGNPLDGVEGLGTRYTGDQLRAKINEVIAKLGGAVSMLLVCALPCLGGVTVQTAPLGGIYSDEPVVTNVIVDVSGKADKANTYTKAETDAKITTATNALVIAAADFSPSNAALVATIEAVAPAPGNYETVSNRAMGAVQSLQPAYDYADATVISLSQTNAVLAGGPYLLTSSNSMDHTVQVQYGTGPGGFTFSPSEIYVPGAAFFDSFWIASNDTRGPLSGIGQYGGAYSTARSEMENFVTSSLSEYATHAQVLAAASSATNYTDGAISTNNAAFVSAVLAVPLTGADAGDLAELAEYGGYGTVGAAIVALIAGLAALKRRMGAAEEAIEGKVSASELPYALVTPGEWEFSGVPRGWSVSGLIWSEIEWVLYLEEEGTGTEVPNYSTSPESSLQLIFNVSVGGGSTITATRASLPGHLCDRAGNRVVVTGDTTLTLPAAVAGYARDFLVRLEISGSTVPTITFAAPTGETIAYETDGDEFPVPDEAGTWLYSFTENCVANKFAVALKKVNVVSQA